MKKFQTDYWVGEHIYRINSTISLKNAERLNYFILLFIRENLYLKNTYLEDNPPRGMFEFIGIITAKIKKNHKIIESLTITKPFCSLVKEKLGGA